MYQFKMHFSVHLYIQVSWYWVYDPVFPSFWTLCCLFSDIQCDSSSWLFLCHVYVSVSLQFFVTCEFFPLVSSPVSCLHVCFSLVSVFGVYFLSSQSVMSPCLFLPVSLCGLVFISVFIVLPALFGQSPVLRTVCSVLLPLSCQSVLAPCSHLLPILTFSCVDFSSPSPSACCLVVPICSVSLVYPKFPSFLVSSWVGFVFCMFAFSSILLQQIKLSPFVYSPVSESCVWVLPCLPYSCTQQQSQTIYENGN